jgi:uncharacterized protein (TIGR03083 family)
MGMRVHEHIAALRREGGLLAESAGRSDPDAPVPTCPEWTVRELVRHTGRVHGWAAAYVREARATPFDESDEGRLFGTMPDDRDLVDWYRDRHARLVEALEQAPEDLACWSFLPAPSPLAFWARRQAHETAIHRADADSAMGPIRGYPADFAADGVDELLAAFMVRAGSRVRSDPPRSLHVRATDADADWTVHMGPTEVHCGRTAEPADCSLRAPAGELYLALWNRRGTDDLEVSGDRSVLAFWRERATVRWS